MPYDDPVIGQLSQPAALDPGCSSVVLAWLANSTPASALWPQGQHVPRVGIRGALLGEQIVAIVPEGHQT